jgi:hypothetical protein
MHQKDKIGGCETTEKKYVTWEIKECPVCNRLVKEYYLAEELSYLKYKIIRGQYVKKNNLNI